MSRDSNSHFEGAIILDDDGLSTDGTGPISYVGFDKSLVTDESAGPRLSGRATSGPPAFIAPRGSIFMPGLDDWAWHNIDGTVTGWRRLLQEGQLPPAPAAPIPAIDGIIAIDLPDTGANLTLDTDLIIPAGVDISQIVDSWGYKLDASGALGCTIQVTIIPLLGVPQTVWGSPLVLNAIFATPHGARINPRDLNVVDTSMIGGATTLRYTQVKANVGDNNAVKVCLEVLGG
jgi:hypothetical protein